MVWLCRDGRVWVPLCFFAKLLKYIMTARPLAAARTQVRPRGAVSLWREAQRTSTACSTSPPLAEARLQVRGPPSPLLRAQVVTPPPLAEPACMSRCSPRWALGATRRARRPDFHRCRRCSKQIGRMRAPAGHLGQPRWSRVGKQLVFCYLFNLCMTARLPVAARTQVWPRGGASLWREAQRTCTLSARCPAVPRRWPCATLRKCWR